MMFKIFCLVSLAVLAVCEENFKSGLNCEQVGDGPNDVICSEPNVTTSTPVPQPGAQKLALAVAPVENAYSEQVAKIPKPLSERASVQRWSPCSLPSPFPYTPSCTLGKVTISPYLLYNSNGEPRYVYQSSEFNQVVTYVRCKRSVCYPRFYAGHSSNVDLSAVENNPRFYPYPYPSGRCYPESKTVSLLVWNPYLFNGLSWESFSFPYCCRCRLTRTWPGLPITL